LVVSAGVGFSRLQGDREASPPLLKAQPASVWAQSEANFQLGRLTIYIVGTQEQLEIVRESVQQEAIVRSATGVSKQAFTPNVLLADTPENEAQTLQLLDSVRTEGVVGNFILEVIDLRDR
jgi:hypothetical protein